MAAPKGHPRYGGRQKGTPNKATAAAREAFQMAFDEAGGVQSLTEWAKDNRTEFYKLYGRLIPLEAAVNMQGVLQVVTGVPRADDG